MGIPDYSTCFLQNLYAGQEAIVRTRQGTMDWFQTGKGVCQCCILSPCLFNFNAEYIMWNARLDETQAGIKIAGRNISNFRYADDTTLMAESQEELKRLLMKVKEQSEKPGLKFNIQNAKIMTSGPITSWQIDGKAMETVRDFLGSKITADGDCSHEIKTHLLLGRTSMINLVKVKSLSRVPTLCDPIDCSPLGSSVHGNFPGKSAGVGCHFLLQGIFLTQGSNPGLPHCRHMLYRLSHQGSPW